MRFFTSKDTVFYGNTVLTGLDPQSFQLFTVVGKKYASLSHVKDKNGVYALDIEIQSVKIHPMNVDVKSFSVLGYGYAIDDTAVYYNENKLNDANPKTFIVEENSSGKYYDATDGVHMYKQGKLVETPTL